MTVTFEKSQRGQCMTPVSGSGSQMLVCGEPAMPGRTCCPACYKVLYVPVTPKTLAVVKATAHEAHRKQRMTMPPLIDAD